jgi:branched-chain amino acid transport system substrate-binding protein
MLRRTLFIIPLFLISCSMLNLGKRPEPETGESRDELYASIQAFDYKSDYKELRRAGMQYLSRYAGDSTAKHVQLLVGKANIELKFYDDAKQVLYPLVEEESPDRLRGKAFLLLAEIDYAKGSFGDTAENLLRALSTDLDESARSRASSLLSDVVRLLSGDQLKYITSTYRGAEGIGIALEWSRLFAESVGDTAFAREVNDQLASMQPRIPAPEEFRDHGEAVPVEMRKGLDSEALRIGFLCPLEGRFSPLGDAFLRGASLALKEARRRGMKNIELIVGDTRASALVARSTALRLINDIDVIAIVGAILSSPTITVAQIAEYHGVVLLSPVATEQGIGDIGDWVFQMVADEEVEIISLARLALGELHLTRIAFLSVDDLNSRNMELLFRGEVERLGGEVVASEFYPAGSTDFREYIVRIRSAAPEALFIPSDAEDLILILPQLSFYEFGVQLLGTSAWNSSSLHKTAGRDMEGAIFPAPIDEDAARRRYTAAAAAVGEPAEEINRFIVGGYLGVRTVLEALQRTGADGEALRIDLSKQFENRRHPFLEYYSGTGIRFHTVRNERVEDFTVLKARD